MDWIDYWQRNDVECLPWETYVPEKNLVEFFSQIDTTRVKTAIDIGCGLELILYGYRLWVLKLMVLIFLR